MKIFYLPDLGEGLTEAEIHEWYIQEGDTVKLDQPIVAMETAKALVDVPAPFSGKIIKCFGKAGDIINTHAPLIGFAEADTGTVVGQLTAETIIVAETAPEEAGQLAVEKSIKTLPAARSLAKQLQVDIQQVHGTGNNGMITLADILAAAKQAPTASLLQTSETETLHGVRRTMAHTMSKAHHEVVPVSIYDDANIHHWPSHTDITVRLICAIIKACQTETVLNAWFDGKNLQRQVHESINLGLAMDSAAGLLVPVIKNVQNLSPTEIRNAIEQYKLAVQNRRIQPENLQAATIVLSNFGTFAGRYASPIVVPPTVAIVATGRIREEVVAWQGQAMIHPILPLSLSFDHRAVTGGEATRFMAALLADLQS